MRRPPAPAGGGVGRCAPHDRCRWTSASAPSQSRRSFARPASCIESLPGDVDHDETARTTYRYAARTRRTTLPIRIVLADDHRIVRDGLRALLEREGFAIAGEASDGQEA